MVKKLMNRIMQYSLPIVIKVKQSPNSNSKTVHY